jgi:acetoin utilization protein AcuB
MRVSDLMTRNVVSIPEAASCRRAVRLMCERKLRHLPVVNEVGKVTGIVTDRDLRHHLFTPRVLPHVGTVPIERLLDAVAVREVMSAPVVTIDPSEPIEAAAALMLERRVGSVVVVADGEVVGIVTETDLLRHIVNDDVSWAAVECIVVSYP